MDVRDIAPSVSFFKGTRVTDDGALTFTGSAGAGTTVDLLVHLPVVVVLVNAPPPRDASPAVNPRVVVAWRADDDLTVPATEEPEYLRALFNTESAWAAARNSEALK
jgi:hypothetical protein